MHSLYALKYKLSLKILLKLSTLLSNRLITLVTNLL
jgi:hypothetical protein